MVSGEKRCGGLKPAQRNAHRAARKKPLGGCCGRYKHLVMGWESGTVEEGKSYLEYC